MGAGPYYVFVEYKDALDQDASSVTQGITIRPSSAVTTLRLASKGPAPGAGALLPAGATITSFNLPAIDDAGNITYVAKWANVTPKASGTGLFLNTTVAWPSSVDCHPLLAAPNTPPSPIL
jgi:hypothetical protein